MAKREDLIGVWRLVSFTAKDEADVTSEPFGPAPSGRLIYLADGIMSAHLGADDRPPLLDMGASGAERALSAMRSHFSYAGRWRLEGDRVLHDVDMSISPDWVGAVKARDVAFDGGDMILTDREPGGRLKVGVLRWRRET
ncbi:MAG: lipocalin-like domain-containing protein [Pseudomonadota bacterium]